VTITNPAGDSATVTFAPQVGPTCSGSGAAEVPAEAGDWTLSFEGAGAFNVQVVGVAS
jgi:hypothetical protein